MKQVTHYFHIGTKHAHIVLQNSFALCGVPDPKIQGVTDLGRVTCEECLKEAAVIGNRLTELFLSYNSKEKS